MNKENRVGKELLDMLEGAELEANAFLEKTSRFLHKKKLIKYNTKTNVDNYVISFIVPGVETKDLLLQVIEGRLRLDVEGDSSAQEIKINSNIPLGIVGRITTEHKNGILYVTVPRHNYEPQIIKIS